MERKRWTRVGLELTALVVLAVLLLHRFLPAKAVAPSAANARIFTLTGLDGKPIPASAYQNKALVLNFWAPWCPPCRMEIPWLQKLQNENQGKLVVVGVVADTNEYVHAADMMQQKGITYLLAQDTASLGDTFGDPNGLPTSFYISPSLHIVHIVSGVVPQYMMQRYASDAIEQK